MATMRKRKWWKFQFLHKAAVDRRKDKMTKRQIRKYLTGIIKEIDEDPDDNYYSIENAYKDLKNLVEALEHDNEFEIFPGGKRG
jgi:hypothetical protein